MAINYKDAGVDVERGYQAVALMKEHVQKTFNSNVLTGLGSFGGFYSIAGEKMENPVLVAGTDGVGTKLKYAFVMQKHDTIGIDAVAMCVNDIICQGAKPLFFLDYIATNRIVPEIIASIVKGISEGCRQSGCALIGGETAEMPGFYANGEYDIAGFSVGIVDKDNIIDGGGVKAGDVLIGLPSSGIHSNGFSLVRKLMGIDSMALERYSSDLACSLGEEVLRPTRIYVSAMQTLLATGAVKGAAHITGGGFIENIPRMLPKGLGARIQLGSWPVLPIFHVMNQISRQTDEEAYNTFNMGIGMVLAVSKGKAEAVLAAAKAQGEKAYVIGEVVQGVGVALCS